MQGGKQALIHHTPLTQNKAMIDKKLLPNMRLAELISSAIDSTGLKDNEIAPLCQVSPQAVYSWRRTGRIGKGTLKKLATVTKRPMSYFLDEEEIIPGSSTTTPATQDSQKAIDETSISISDINKLMDSFLRSDDKGRRQILALAVDVAARCANAVRSTANDQR